VRTAIEPSSTIISHIFAAENTFKFSSLFREISIFLLDFWKNSAKIFCRRLFVSAPRCKSTITDCNKAFAAGIGCDKQISNFSDRFLATFLSKSLTFIKNQPKIDVRSWNTLSSQPIPAANALLQSVIVLLQPDALTNKRRQNIFAKFFQKSGKKMDISRKSEENLKVFSAANIWDMIVIDGSMAVLTTKGVHFLHF